jgi:Tol biopolymer transport system component
VSLAAAGDPSSEIRATNTKAGETCRLPGLPAWSPDREHLVYSTVPLAELAGAVWLADADWENPRQVAGAAWLAWETPWLPEGDRIALALPETEGEGSSVAIYDLMTERLTPLIAARDLTAAVLRPEGAFVTDGADPTLLADRPLS